MVKAGLYHLSAAFFSHCKASFQVLVNDRVVIRAGSHAACAGQHTLAQQSDALMQQIAKGLSVDDYLGIPAEACLTVKILPQSQHDGAHGFLALQQLC